MQSLATPLPQRSRRASPAAKRQERVMFVRYRRDGDLKARRDLIERFLPLAQKLARRYQRQSEPLDDLVQVARLGLVKAVDGYDSTRGSEFSSYAVPTILGELRRYFRDSTWAVHVPRGMQEQALHLAGVIEQLANQLGTSPTPRQIASAAGMSVEDVIEVLVAGAGHDTQSLESPFRRGDADTGTLADTLGEVDDGFDLAEARPEVAKAMRWLPERERTILYLRFREDLTQVEIAQRLGISQMHVSRLIRRALERLRILVGEE